MHRYHFPTFVIIFLQKLIIEINENFNYYSVKLINTVFLSYLKRERKRTLTIPWTFSNIRPKAFMRSDSKVPDRFYECSTSAFVRLRPFHYPEKLRNGHETVRNVGRSGTLRNGQERSGTVNGTLDGQERLQNHVHSTVTVRSRFKNERNTQKIWIFKSFCYL